MFITETLQQDVLQRSLTLSLQKFYRDVRYRDSTTRCSTEISYSIVTEVLQRHYDVFYSDVHHRDLLLYCYRSSTTRCSTLSLQMFYRHVTTRCSTLSLQMFYRELLLYCYRSYTVLFVTEISYSIVTEVIQCCSLQRSLTLLLQKFYNKMFYSIVTDVLQRCSSQRVHNKMFITEISYSIVTEVL